MAAALVSSALIFLLCRPILISLVSMDFLQAKYKYMIMQNYPPKTLFQRKSSTQSKAVSLLIGCEKNYLDIKYKFSVIQNRKLTRPENGRVAS
jgi:hypothetical protein